MELVTILLRKYVTEVNTGCWVQFAEKMEGNGIIKRGAMDLFFAQSRKVKEIEWIKTLRTAYPYKMKDEVSDETTMKGKLICS